MAEIMFDGKPLRLTEWTSCGGCAAKWGKDLLAGLVNELPASVDPSLLIGLAPFDDAAVYKVSDDIALVSTTDFFPPLVDDPSDFGAIAAANACSDVYAMGGKVLMAVNVAAFPENFPREAIVAIFAAASDVMAQAGGSVAGGHTPFVTLNQFLDWRFKALCIPIASSLRVERAKVTCCFCRNRSAPGLHLLVDLIQTRPPLLLVCVD